MIWYNKTKTRKINLSNVVAYNYTSAPERLINSPNAFASSNTRGSILELILGGGAMSIEGKDADDIFAILKKEE